MKRKQSQKYLRKRIAATGLSAIMAGTTIVGMLPANVYAVTGSQVAKDGTYTSKDATVDISDMNDNEPTYQPSVSITVKDGKIADVSAQSNADDEDNQDYFDRALNGYRNSQGIKSQLVGKAATSETINGVDAVTRATRSSNALKQDLQYALAGAPADESSDTPDTPTEDKTFEIDAYSGYTMQDLYQNNKFDMDSAAIWKFTTISKYVGGSSASTQDFAFPTTVKEIQGYDGLTQHQTQLNPYYYNYGHNVIFQSGCNTTVSGIDFRSDTSLFGGDPSSVDVTVKSGANVTFKNCTFEGKLIVEDGATVQFENCQVHYGVSYDANGGENAPASATGTLTNDSITVQIPDTVPTREGYTFAGYATSKDAATAQYQAGDTITVTPGNANVTLYAVWKEGTEPTTEEGYVLMNIPYDKFYEAEGTNLKADVVTSATKQKTRSNTIVPGSYHEKSDGSEINGVTFPVKVSDLSKLTGTKVTDDTTVSVTTTIRGKESTNDYKGRDALFENSSYAYYILPSNETPSYYKELTVNADGSYSFGKTQSTTTANAVTETNAELDSGVEAKHGGDYEIKLNDYADTLKQNNVSKVYGVIMHTQENKDYAFRHLENIWTPKSGEFGFSVGHTTVGGHGSPVSSVNFKDAEGKTVTGFTVYTDKGVDEVNLSNSMKLVRFASENVTASADDDHTISITNIPSDAENVTASVYYEKAGDNGKTSKEYVTDKKNPSKVENGKLVLPEGKTLEDGTTYTIRVYSSNYATQGTEIKYAKENPETKATYVVMNIPYSEFYASDKVDADVVTSATKAKTRSTLAAGSYHVNNDGSDITGVSFPVKVDDPSILKELKDVTDDKNYDITITLRGNATTTTYKDADKLFENAGTHAYYRLSETPSFYKELTVDENGNFTFSAVKGQDGKELTANQSTKDVSISEGADTRHTDYEFTVSDYKPSRIYGAVLHTKDGDTTKDYALRHLENIWVNGEFGFNTGHKGTDAAFNDIEGKTLTGMTVYTADGIDEIKFNNPVTATKIPTFTTRRTGNTIKLKGIPADIKNAKARIYYLKAGGRRPSTEYVTDEIAVTDGQFTIPEGTTLDEDTTYYVELSSDNYATNTATFIAGPYVIMNIPYSEFYASDKVDADVVTSATKVKTRNGDLVGGSYHVNADGSDITGVSFPVKVSDPAVLEKLKDVTDEDDYSITINNRGRDVTTTYKDADKLFENAGTHAYYQLDAIPTFYKELTVDKNGNFTFSAVKGQDGKALAVTPFTKTVTISDGADTHHTDYEFTVSEYAPSRIYGAILHTKDGDTTKDYALRHLENIWRGGEFGFNTGHKGTDAAFNDIEGRTLTGMTVYTADGIDEITFKTPVTVKPTASVEVTAASSDGKTVSVTGLPKDIQNAKATVYYQEQVEGQRRPKTVNVAEGIEVKDGKAALPDGTTLEDGKEYFVTVESDNYAALSSSFTYKKSSSHSGGGSTVTPAPTPTPAPSKMKFTDVSEKAYYHDAVQWAIDNKVTTGTTDTTFSPNEYCTRGQMIQFLYNLAGKPAVSGTAPFTDVNSDTFYHDAVIWAYQNGITAGTSATTFSPNAYCSRSYMVQFLYSKAGKPAVSGMMPFSDVKAGRYYYNAVLWAYQKGITAGTTATTFSPNENCTRGQMAQFLYKASKI